jgi:hypothetical protein
VCVCVCVCVCVQKVLCCNLGCCNCQKAQIAWRERGGLAVWRMCVCVFCVVCVLCVVCLCVVGVCWGCVCVCRPV